MTGLDTNNIYICRSNQNHFHMKKIIVMASTLIMAASTSLSANTPGNGKLSFNPPTQRQPPRSGYR